MSDERVGRFAYCAPTRVTVGDGASRTCGPEIGRLGFRRPLVVSDERLVGIGLVEPIVRSLTDAGLEVALYDGVSPNPRDKECEAGRAACRAHDADIIVALGGGSVIDAAKAIALLAENAPPLDQYFGWDKLVGPVTPLVAIPTTAGTGSEVTLCAVVTATSGELPVKDAILDRRLYPTAAFLDPELLTGLPPDLTLSTGMDALAHAIESYTCTAATPLSDMWALLAIRAIGRSLRRSCLDGADRHARAEMALAASAAGIAISNSDTCAVHSLSEAIGGLTDAAHGCLNAVILPSVIRFNAESAPERHAAVARALGIDVTDLTDLESGLAVAEWLTDLLEEFEVPTLAQQGVRRELFPLYSELALGVVCTPSNPRPLTQDGFTEILETAWSGHSGRPSQPARSRDHERLGDAQLQIHEQDSMTDEATKGMRR